MTFNLKTQEDADKLAAAAATLTRLGAADTVEARDKSQELAEAARTVTAHGYFYADSATRDAKHFKPVPKCKNNTLAFVTTLSNETYLMRKVDGGWSHRHGSADGAAVSLNFPSVGDGKEKRVEVVQFVDPARPVQLPHSVARTAATILRDNDYPHSASAIREAINKAKAATGE